MAAVGRAALFSCAFASIVFAGCASTRAAAPSPLSAPVTQASAKRLAAPLTKVDEAPAAHGELFVDKELGFELAKPPGDAWAIATNVTSPEGRPIPVVVAHPQSGAQIVVQVSEAVDSPKNLATMLRGKLQEEKSLELGEARKLAVDSGHDAYGFDFKVKGEADGRVAIIDCGERVVLVVASWPEDAKPGIVQDIDGVVRSVRQPSAVNPAMMRNDKA